MSWTIWILFSACFLALYDLAKKASVRDNAVLPVLLCSTTFGCLAFMTVVALSGDWVSVWTRVDAQVTVLGIAKALIVAVSWIFTFCALRTLPITIATPIRASAPALVLVLAMVIYAERPSALQFVGMGAVFAGYWLFSRAGKFEGIDFLRNRAVWCAVAGAVFSAASSLFDKFVFQRMNAPVEPVQFVFQLSLIGVYAVAFLGALLFAKMGALPVKRFEWRWTIPCVGTLLAAADWLYFNGLSIPETPISVASLMRRFSVAITFVLGALCFRENNLRRKGVALALLLAGIVVLCLAG